MRPALALVPLLAVLLATATAAADPGPQRGPPGDRTTRRDLMVIERDLDARLVDLERVQARIEELSSLRMNTRRQAELKALARQAIDIAWRLRQTQRELREAIRDLRPPMPTVDPRPEPVRPPPGPRPMGPNEFAFLLQTIDRVTFSEAQLRAIQDAIDAGAWFDIDQAVRLVERLTYESWMVEAGALVCPRVLERGALPHLLSVFDFESWRQAFRDRVQGRCGLP